MAHETMENRSRIRRTPRATGPVCERRLPKSIRKMVVNRKMALPLSLEQNFADLRNVAHAFSGSNET
jgi:hypothetical protein